MGASSRVVKTLDEGAALRFVAEELSKDEHLLEAETLARQAAMPHEKLILLVGSGGDFVVPANQNALAEWSSDCRTKFPVHFDYNQGRPLQIELRKSGARPTIVPTPLTLQDDFGVASGRCLFEGCVTPTTTITHRQASPTLHIRGIIVLGPPVNGLTTGWQLAAAGAPSGALRIASGCWSFGN